MMANNRQLDSDIYMYRLSDTIWVSKYIRLDRHRYCRCTASLLLNACWMNFVERMLCVVFCYILLIKMIEYM